VHTIVLVTSAEHLWRASFEFAATGLQVVPAPAGVWADRHLGVLGFLPDAQALVRSYHATYELLGEPVRELLALSHLRRH
jgi:uncharacterized SAM-binding protein YcdF (DUF218 family)